jgi:glycosyltransferase involved in cell wall biosynthesis
VNEHNIGAVDLVMQWNTCLAQAKGEYCICIGDDDMLTPDCLATYASYIDKYPFAGILHGQTDIIDENGELICHTPPRPSWESAMSLLYNRTYIYRQQFIGDFCYNCAELKARGGFYTLPLAWGSDDISAIEAAKTGGIANTSEVIFLYRSNRMSITKQTFVRQKIKACILEARWKWIFLRHAQSELQDEKYRNILRKGLLMRTAKNIYYIMRNAWHK